MAGRPGAGWQHGPVPDPPEGLSPAAVDAWRTWFSAWWASYWLPSDLPTLLMVIRLYDQAVRGAASAAVRAETRLWMDSMGISPKGRQDRRWTRAAEPTARPANPYDRLKVVDLAARRPAEEPADG